MTARRSDVDVADSHPRLLTLADARQAGLAPEIPRRRQASGRWVRLAPRVFCMEPPPTVHDLRLAAALHAGPDAVLSGAAALAEWGFRIPSPSSELVLVPTDCHVASWGRIRVRKSARVPVPRWTEGIPLAPPARAVADYVVTQRRADHVQAVVAHAIQRSLCTVDDLIIEYAAGPQRGSHHFREALIDAGYGAHSVPEAKAGRLLRDAGIQLIQNAEIHLGGRRFVADFLDPVTRSIIEIDSTEFHLSPDDHDATLRRDQLLQLGGYRVLHVKPRQLADYPERFVRDVRMWLSIAIKPA